ncbi:MAG: exosortase H [Phycisphaerales bacterium]|nr:exosortase H [Phycisphaerales bacterium]
MSRSVRQDRTAPTPRSASHTSRGRGQAIRFVLGFAILAGIGFALTASAWFGAHVLTPYLGLNARLSAAALRLLGEQASAAGWMLTSPRMSLSIQRGCDAIDAMVLYAAALSAMPGILPRRKVLGLCAGLLALATLNIVRIVALYYIGVRWPSLFDLMHVEVLQAVFIFLALVGWIAWAWWATAPKASPPRSSDEPAGAPS